MKPMIKYALFIEPDAPLREFLLARKAWVASNKPGEPYCHHPPHCTLIVGRYGPPALWSKQVADVLAHEDPFVLACENYHVFYDDVLTGGHTVAVRVLPSHALSSLQQKLAEVLSDYIDVVEPLRAPLDQEPYSSSTQKYGFPFVGDHWMPHFSIASLRTDRDDSMLKQLLEEPISREVSVSEIAIWKVTDDEHERLEMLPLG